MLPSGGSCLTLSPHEQQSEFPDIKMQRIRCVSFYMLTGSSKLQTQVTPALVEVRAEPIFGKRPYIFWMGEDNEGPFRPPRPPGESKQRLHPDRPPGPPPKRQRTDAPAIEDEPPNSGGEGGGESEVLSDLEDAWQQGTPTPPNSDVLSDVIMFEWAGPWIS